MSSRINKPTPYPEVNALLEELLASAQAILGRQFIGAYLFGSLTSGDFDQASDVDVVVVTEAEISDAVCAALAAMHARLAAGASWWATQLEVSYMPQRALRRHDPAAALHPHLDRGKGERLRLMQHDSDWVVQRAALRERGITLAGPAPQTLIDPVSPDDLRRAMLAVLWWPAQILAAPAQISELGYQSYIVLTLCRMLYTLQFGTIISKPAAARWAQATLSARWSPLIERAWLGRQTPQMKATADDINETLDFIRYTLARSQQSEPAAPAG